MDEIKQEVRNLLNLINRVKTNPLSNIARQRLYSGLVIFKQYTRKIKREGNVRIFNEMNRYIEMAEVELLNP